MPAGGRGYTRPPSLVSVWSTAPFLLNNSIGPFSEDPSVKSRMTVFQASIEQLLWPVRRAKDAVLGDKVPGVIDRTTARSWIFIPAGFQPALLKPLRDSFHHLLPGLINPQGDITLGPIPAGVPIDLLANLQPLPESSNPITIADHSAKLVNLLLRLQNADDAERDNAHGRGIEEQVDEIIARQEDRVEALENRPDDRQPDNDRQGSEFARTDPIEESADRAADAGFVRDTFVRAIEQRGGAFLVAAHG
jgi:hypothetical protein